MVNQSLEVLILVCMPSVVQVLFMVILCWELPVLVGKLISEVL